MWLLQSYAKRYKKVFVGSLLLATVNQIFSLINPQIFRLLIDDYANKVDQHTYQSFMQGVLILLGIGVGAAAVSRVAKTFQDYYVNYLSQKIWAGIYGQGIAHSFTLPYRVFEDWRSGALLDKLQKARNDIQKLLNSMINTVFLTLIGMVIVIGYAFYVHWIIGSLFLLMIPLLGLTTYAISSRVRSAQKKIVAASAELSGSTVEDIKNVELVKSLWLEWQETDRLLWVNERLIELEVDKLKLIKTLTFSQWTMINFLRSALQLVMLYFVFMQTISVWEFFSLLFYSFFVFNPLYELPTVAINYQEAKASSETLEEIFGLEPEKVPDNAKRVKALDRLQFAGVGFGYGEELTVKWVDWEIEKWESIAFVGPSGAGKSTLIKMICGLYKASEGTITYNGIDSKELDWTSVKQHIGIVAQNAQLFSGTIRENLQFVSPDASDEECLQVLEQAELKTLVEDKEWLDTKIGEGGLKLSWGQRQRLAIARALLRKPDLLIFDEATSSLDSLVEGKITDTIKWIAQKNNHLMSILVAHRLSTIMHVDRIYVLENGNLIESGNHESLLKEWGLYAALWRQQGGKVL